MSAQLAPSHRIVSLSFSLASFCYRRRDVLCEDNTTHQHSIFLNHIPTITHDRSKDRGCACEQCGVCVRDGSGVCARASCEFNLKINGFELKVEQKLFEREGSTMYARWTKNAPAPLALGRVAGCVCETRPRRGVRPITLVVASTCSIGFVSSHVRLDHLAMHRRTSGGSPKEGSEIGGAGRV